MIDKAALILLRKTPEGMALLFVRPHHSRFWLLPGGKQEQGETIEAALSREIEEELSAKVVDVHADRQVTGSTPDGRPLRLHLFKGQLIGIPTPSAEIGTLAWFTRSQAMSRSAEMTPMTIDHVMPALDDVW